MTLETKIDSQLLRNVSMELFEVAKSYLEKVQVEDPIDRVEGHRFLLRMLSTAINARVNYDVDQPSFFHFVTPHFKMYLDSPDTDYQRCNISLSQDRVYRISATVPSNIVYFGLQLYGPSGRIGNRLVDHDITHHPTTRQVVVYVAAASTDLSTLQIPELKPQHDTSTSVNILRGEKDDIVLIARQYFTNRKVEERISWTVELVHRAGSVSPAAQTPEPALPAGYTPHRSAKKHIGGIVSQMRLEWNAAQNEARHLLESAGLVMDSEQRQEEERLWAQRVDEARRGFEELLDNTTHAYQMIQHLPANEAVLIGVGTRLCPTPDNRYNLGRACLRPGKMLLVRGQRRPTCRYFSVCLVNKWLESLDYLRHQIYLNHQQIQWEDDGSFEVCVSLHHLKHKNHLYADNHYELLILIRELLPEDEVPLEYSITEENIPQHMLLAPSKSSM